MKRIHTIFCVALVLAMLGMGCAKPPTEEMNNAAEAVTRAENDKDAVTYAFNSITRAKDALEHMKTEADSKRYDAAKSYAAEAIAAAERAITDGRAGAERARSEASSLVAQLRPLIAETEQGITAARAAGLPLDFESVDTDFNTARRNADQAQTALSATRYEESMERGRAARLGLNSINQQLAIATLAVSRKK
jgi:hypothetical protein